MSNGWHEWSRHVLAELRRLNDSLQNLEDKLTEYKEDSQDQDHQLDVRVSVLESQKDDAKGKNSRNWAMLVGVVTGLIALGAAIVQIFVK